MKVTMSLAAMTVCLILAADGMAGTVVKVKMRDADGASVGKEVLSVAPMVIAMKHVDGRLALVTIGANTFGGDSRIYFEAPFCVGEPMIQYILKGLDVAVTGREATMWLPVVGVEPRTITPRSSLVITDASSVVWERHPSGCIEDDVFSSVQAVPADRGDNLIEKYLPPFEVEIQTMSIP